MKQTKAPITSALEGIKGEGARIKGGRRDEDNPY
jgi:hypothetical protein